MPKEPLDPVAAVVQLVCHSVTLPIMHTHTHIYSTTGHGVCVKYVYSQWCHGMCVKCGNSQWCHGMCVKCGNSSGIMVHGVCVFPRVVHISGLDPGLFEGRG